jgi:hypothetical protein
MLLDEVGLVHERNPNYLLIPFEAQGSDFIEDGTQINLIATWKNNSVTIQVSLMDLADDEQNELDSTFVTVPESQLAERSRSQNSYKSSPSTPLRGQLQIWRIPSRSDLS